MPRIAGIFSLLAGTKGTPGTTIESAKYNAAMDDLAADANAPRPITAGGTGAANVTDAKTNLGLAAIASTGSASDLIAGTIADARLPGTMTLKTFTPDGGVTRSTQVDGGSIELFNTASAYIDFKNAASDDFDVRIIQNGANGLQIVAPGGVSTSAAIFATGSITSSADVIATGNLSALSGNVFNNANSGNPNYWLRRGGVSRGVMYHDGSNIVFNNYDGSGGFLTSFAFQANGYLSAPIIQSAGRVYSGNGASFLESNGNILFSSSFATSYGADLGVALSARIKNDGGTYGINISGNAANSVALNGRTGTEPTVNSSVAFRDGTGAITAASFLARTSGGAGTGALANDGNVYGSVWGGSGDYLSNYLNNTFNGKQNSLGFTPVQQGTGIGQQPNTVKIGWSSSSQLRLTVDGSDFGATWPHDISGNAANATTAANANNLGGVAASRYAQFESAASGGQSIYPIGQILAASGGLQNRRATVNLYAMVGDPSYFTIAAGGAALAGTWVQCGQISSTVATYQRVA